MCDSEGPSIIPSAAKRAVLPALQHLLHTYESVHTDDMRNSELGHWINEAFVVRLFAVLEAHDVVSRWKSIDDSLVGAAEVDICRRFRNKIAHSKATVGSPSSRKLDLNARDAFGLGDQESRFEGKFILAKDTVLRPMHKACYSYCQALIERESAVYQTSVAGGIFSPVTSRLAGLGSHLRWTVWGLHA